MIEDILSLIVAVLLTVLPALQKKAKKARDKRRRTQPQEVVIDESQTVVLQEKENPYAYGCETLQSSSDAEERVPLSRQPLVPSAKTVSRECPSIPSHDTAPKVAEDRPEDFDLRKAILFSEILHPKF